MRRVPATMATQHPDSAAKHVLVGEEVDEAISCLKREENGLGCEEYLIDYLGKLTPYHQIGQIIKKMSEATDLIPGKDVFLTPRMVSSFKEEPFRQLMTLVALMEGMYNSMQIYGEPGVREMVHGMTTVNELKMCKERAERILTVISKELPSLEKGELQIIPLFEGVPEFLSLRETMSEFIEEVGGTRVFLGKSETSLIYGHPASSLSCKIALADCYEIQQDLNVDLFPIFGGGALPFRGHITLENADNFLKEYKGSKTCTIQSGMRYDHGKEKTRKLVEKIRIATENRQYQEFNDEDRRNIIRMITIFAKNYLQELSKIADIVTKIAELVPNQRDRLLESTDVAYYREIRNIKALPNFCLDQDIKSVIFELDSNKFLKMPRGIKVTAAFYTCGLPPEFIGTGNAFSEIEEKMGSRWLDKLLEEIFPSLEEDLIFASKFLNIERQNPLLTDRIMENFKILKQFIDFREPDNSYLILTRTANDCIRDLWEGKGLMPQKFSIMLHDGSVAEYLGGSIRENLAKLILDTGKIRGSLG